MRVLDALRAHSRSAVAAGLLGLLPGGCAAPQRVQLRQEMHLGQFTLKAVSVDVYSRAHQGVPLQVDVEFDCDGGNRFDRAEFAENVSRRGRVYFHASDGWTDRGWLLRRGDDARSFHLDANPPLGTHGYTIEIGNPYGQPSRFILDLGK